jgi:alpha-beta hydrolase superfamily lysophospholipase
MTADAFYTDDADGGRLYVRRWMPVAPRAAIVVAHGAAEHGGRYARFASALQARGIATYAPDHRGHGMTATPERPVGNAGVDGFNGMIRDLRVVIELAREQLGEKPIILFGHSMGAALSQRFVQLHGHSLHALILSGSPGLRPNLERVAELDAAAALGANAEQVSTRFAKTFETFNQGFDALPGQPERTGFEWLSRDVNEVLAYVGDPNCGFPFTNRLVAEIAACALEAAQPANIELIPKTLPILLFAGTQDRVGGNGAFVETLANRYRASGIDDVRVMLYANGRHEMLNEKNRDVVQRDIIEWLESHL